MPHENPEVVSSLIEMIEGKFRISDKDKGK